MRIEWTLRRSMMGSGKRGDRCKSDVAAAHVFLATALIIVWAGVGAGKASAALPNGPTLGDLIRALKRREKTLGFHKTKNFRNHSNQTAADYRCYYTEK